VPPLVVGVGVRVDLSSLRFVLLGCDSFALRAVCLVLGGEAFSLRVGGLLFRGESRLFGTSTAHGCLVSVRRGSGAALVELLGALAPRHHREDDDTTIATMTMMMSPLDTRSGIAAPFGSLASHADRTTPGNAAES
jgi:hypothetical protein